MRDKKDLNRFLVCLLIFIASGLYMFSVHDTVMRYGFDKHPYKFHIDNKEHRVPTHHYQDHEYYFHVTDKNDNYNRFSVTYSTYNNCQRNSNVTFDVAIREVDVDWKLEILHALYIFSMMLGIGLNTVLMIVFFTSYIDSKKINYECNCNSC